MYNDLFSIGPVTIHGYGLMIAIGFMTALMVGMKRAKNKGLNSDYVFDLGILCLVSGFLSAKVLYCIVEIKTMLEDPKQIISSNGFVVYGGIIGGIAAAFIFCRIKKISFWHYFDLVLPSVAIAQGIGRIGCFLAGCCYGRETDSWIGIAFKNSTMAPNGVKLIPTQLISCAGCLLLAAMLIWYARKGRKPGRVGALYLIFYSIGRFLIEFLRNDYRGSIGFLSTSQFISIFILIIGVVLFFIKTEPNKKEIDSE